MESLANENSNLRDELQRLSEECEKLSSENGSIKVWKLTPFVVYSVSLHVVTACLLLPFNYLHLVFPDLVGKDRKPKIMSHNELIC